MVGNPPPEDDRSNGDMNRSENDEILQDIDKSLSEDMSQEDRQIVEQYVARHTSGPLPSGAEMREYQLVDPELPRLIFDMAETEQKHRHRLEMNEQQKSYEAIYKNQEDGRQTAKRGQLLGFGIAVIVLGLAALMAVLGFPTLAVILAGVDVVGLAAVFVSSYKMTKRLDDPDDHDPKSENLT